MNKVHREKSLRIKQAMRLSKWPLTYKEAKVLVRNRERKSRKAAEFYMKYVYKEGSNEFPEAIILPPRG